MVDPTPAGRHGIVIWMILLVAVLAAYDLVSAYMRDHQVRYVSVVIFLLLLVCAGIMAQRGRA